MRGIIDVGPVVWGVLFGFSLGCCVIGTYYEDPVVACLSALGLALTSFRMFWEMW